MTPPEQPMSVEEASNDDAMSVPDRASDRALPGQSMLFGDVTAAPGEAPTESNTFLDKVLAIDGTPSPVYVGAFIFGSLLLVFSAALGLFPWPASALGIFGLLATMFRRGYWVTLLCAAGVLVVVVLAVWPRQPTLADALPLDTSGDQTVAEQVPEGSLGFRLDELTDLWNSLDEPPRIDRGFSRSSEPGRLDSFVLRFDQGASLAGAYDPNDDHVFALSASSRLDHESATTMYLHLCFMLHPYSQECIDAYWEEGLDGRTSEYYLGTRHSAEWEMGDRTWRLAIVGNVQEIKVLGNPPP